MRPCARVKISTIALVPRHGHVQHKCKVCNLGTGLCRFLRLPDPTREWRARQSRSFIPVLPHQGGIVGPTFSPAPTAPERPSEPMWFHVFARISADALQALAFSPVGWRAGWLFSTTMVAAMPHASIQFNFSITTLVAPGQFVTQQLTGRLFSPHKFGSHEALGAIGKFFALETRFTFRAAARGWRT